MEMQNDSKSGGNWQGMHGKGFLAPMKLVLVVLAVFLLVLTIKELKSYGYVGAGLPADSAPALPADLGTSATFRRGAILSGSGSHMATGFWAG